MNELHGDTICALATPPGVAGLAVIRVSGPNAVAVCSSCFTSAVALSQAPSHTIRVGWWMAGTTRIDEVTCTLFLAPNSYTGEDVVEIGCHGGVFVVNQIIASLVDWGVRPALPGEFTRRAFVNHKLDLTQVEAVADIIHSQSVPGAQTAARQLAGGFTAQLSDLRYQLLSAAGLLEVELDFSEEGYEFVSREAFAKAVSKGLSVVSNLLDSARAAEVLRSGFQVAIAGYPNAGKSSLFNALLGRDRAIVSPVAGTTRDYIQEQLVIDGCTVHLVDTAGLRDTADTIEMQGIRITRSQIEQSNLVLVVNDASAGFAHSMGLCAELEDKFPGHKVVTVQNKMDLLNMDLGQWDSLVPAGHVAVSSLHPEGVSALRGILSEAVSASYDGVMDALVNARQAALLQTIKTTLESTLRSLQHNIPADLIAIDVRSAVRVIGEITGETWNPDVLDQVFSRFCIGK